MTEPAEAARDVTIVPITTAAQWRDFHALPPRIYADDPHWVRPLRLDRRMQFSARHNPFFAHARTAFWIAYRGREPVGTISAQIDRLHLERYADATGHFGALEAIDDPAVVAALLRQAELWLAR